MFRAPALNPHNIFWHVSFQTHPSWGSKNRFSGPWCEEVWVLGAPPLNPQNVFWHGAFQTHLSYVSKNSFSGPWCAEVWVIGAPPLHPHNIFWHGAFQTHQSRYRNHLFRPVLCRGMGVRSATHEPTPYFLAWCVSNTPILGIHKQLSWPVVCRYMGVYVCMCMCVCVYGAPPLNPHNFFWRGAFQTHPSQVSKNPLCDPGVHKHGCFQHQPRTRTTFLACCISNTAIQGIQKQLFWPAVCTGMGVSSASPEPTQYPPP